jgi:hypothetical protein
VGVDEMPEKSLRKQKLDYFFREALQMAFFMFCIFAGFLTSNLLVTGFFWQAIFDLSPGAFNAGLGLMMIPILGLNCFIGFIIGYIVAWFIWYKLLKRT